MPPSTSSSPTVDSGVCAAPSPASEVVPAVPTMSATPKSVIAVEVAPTR